MTNMRSFFAKINLFALLTITFLVACKKDDTTPAQPEAIFARNNGVEQIVDRTTQSQGDDSLCFEISFPITVELPDGTAQTANTLEELEAIYETWFQDNPNANTCPAIAYPLTVTLEDGTVQTVDSEEELFTLLEDCFEFEGGWEGCFAIQYPVGIVYPDGTTVTYNSESDMFQDLSQWYDNNPMDSLYPVFDYPITVVKADGTIVTANNDMDLDVIYEECYGTWEPGEPTVECFEYVYPVRVALPDGTTQTANDAAELDLVFINWFENHPFDTTGFPVIAYPLNLRLANGDLVTVNSDEELFAIFDDCYGTSEPGGGLEDCFTFNYPLTIVFPDGTAPVINDDEELWTAIFDWYDNNPDSDEDPTFGYPIQVTLTADGSIVTVTSDEQLNEIIETCFECLVGNGNGLVLGGKSSVAAKAALQHHGKAQKAAKQRVAKMLAPKQATSAKRF